MTQGRLIAVVGPSGVGKDSIMDGLIATAPSVKRIRRAITRAPGLGGEDYDAMTPDAFEAAVQSGAFCLHWDAHGLRYGLPVETLADINDGRHCLANFSRTALDTASRSVPRFTVLNITAHPETLAKRLAARGRESAAEIERRLAQAVKPLPPGLDVVTISNDGALQDAIDAACTALKLPTQKLEKSH